MQLSSPLRPNPSALNKPMILTLFVFTHSTLLQKHGSSQVLLGRSTDDVDVDIDLRKEGRANKISRRQAIIKMETDGSFFLKNLGKSSISVNGKSVDSGQLLSLGSSCLIEIRGMSFVFEINHKYVRRRYLDTITKKNQRKKSNFEWSPGREP